MNLRQPSAMQMQRDQCQGCTVAAVATALANAATNPRMLASIISTPASKERVEQRFVNIVWISDVYLGSIPIYCRRSIVNENRSAIFNVVKRCEVPFQFYTRGRILVSRNEKGTIERHSSDRRFFVINSLINLHFDLTIRNNNTVFLDMSESIDQSVQSDWDMRIEILIQAV